MISKNATYIFFSELATFLQSGIPVVKAFTSLESSNVFNAKLRKDLFSVRRELEKGRTLAETLGEKGLFHPLYINLVSAGEKSGNLPLISKKISELVKREITFKKRILVSLIYPILLVHLAILGPSAPIAVTSGISTYILFVLKQFIMIYGAVIFLYFICQFIYASQSLSLVFDSIIKYTPVLGKFINTYTLYRFYLSFYYLFDSGCNMGYSFQKSAAFITNRSIKSSFLPVLEKIKNDLPLEEALKNNKIFSLTDTNFLLTGEMSGTLDERLKDILVNYEEKIELQLSAMEKLLPYIVFLGVAVFVGWTVIKFWLGYFNQINELL